LEPKDLCDLSDYTYGVPVILVSQGRSGSGVTWDTLSNLAASHNESNWQHAVEATGGSTRGALRQLDKHADEHGKCWLQKILCERQSHNRNKVNNGKGKESAIFGTKWKPYREVMEHPRAQQALQWLAASPYIKVIYNERNPLDVTLSKYKHKELDYLAPHCYNTECQETAKKALGSLHIPPQTVLQSLKKAQRTINLARQSFASVAKLEVTYDTLYYGQGVVAEWARMLRFVGQAQKADALTLENIKTKITHLATHPPFRNQTIANYDEIEERLQGTEFAYLIEET
jgi:hypothetical protein